MSSTMQELSEYPFPIAASHRLMNMEFHPSTGVNRMFDIVEMSLRYPMVPGNKYWLATGI